MASRVHADADDLRAFAHDIENFAGRAYDDIQELQARFSGLDWDDAQQQKFAEELKETVDQLRSFLDSVKDLAPDLMRMADHLETYLTS